MDLEQKLFARRVELPRREDVEPEFGFTEADGVYYESLTAAQRTQYFRTLMRYDRKNRPRPSADPHGEARLVAWCLKGPGGKRVVSEANVPRLSMQFPSAVINRAYAKCAELSGISEKDEDDFAEELAADPSDAERSTSPNGSASGT